LRGASKPTQPSSSTGARTTSQIGGGFSSRRAQAQVDESSGHDAAALAVIDSPGDGRGEPWTIERLRAAREAYRVEHANGLRLDPEARN
jgi:hypothetical protein